MKVNNIHTRIISQPKEKVAKLFETLATTEDKIWPNTKWPKIKFKDGLVVGARGGHGPIRYKVSKIIPHEYVEFQFEKPKNFLGTHAFFLESLGENQTKVSHTIKMNTKGIAATLQWIFVIRWLHDALLEDALDNIESYFSGETKRTEWSIWVQLLRKLLK